MNSIKETLESSSIHAIPNIVKSKYKIIKLMWSFFFMISLVGCGWFMCNSISDYMQYDVVTKIRINHVQKIQFPIVTICDLNFVINKKVDDYYKQVIDEKSIQLLQIEYLKIEIKNKEKKDTKNMSSLVLMNYINETFIKCSFGSIACNFENDFKIFYDGYYGYCYRFNPKLEKYIFKNGKFSGLSLQMLIGKSSENDNPISIDHGFNIFIQDNPDVDSYSREGISIQTGTSTKIVLNKYLQIKQPKPYSDCIQNLNTVNDYNSEIYNRTIRFNVKYNHENCLQICAQKMVADNCSCQYSDVKFTFYDNVRFCGDYSNISDYEKIEKIEADNNCSLRIWNEFSQSSIAIKNCDCPTECENSGYNYFVSTGEFPTKNYYEFHLRNNSVIKRRFNNKENISYQDVKESIAKVNIFFDSLKETIISEEIKTTFPDLISNLGGLLGLFLGLSFLSLIELFEILLQIYIRKALVN